MATFVVRPQEPLTLAIKAQTCIACFQQCLHKAALIHPREFSMVEDQLGRFRVWTGSMRVFGTSRQSLDHRLREARDVRDTFAALLEAIDYRAKSCISSLELLNLQRSDGGLAAENKVFYQAVSGIADQISLLNKLSNTVRRASKESQNIDADKALLICDDDGNDAEDFLRQVYVHYIQDRFPAASAGIQQRLASTMVLRRKRILYRRSRYGNNPIQAPRAQPRHHLQNSDAHEDTAGAQSRARSDIKSVAQSATTLAVEKFRKASAPSVVSVNKTVALSSHKDLVFPPAPTADIKSKLRQLIGQTEDGTRHQTGSEPSSKNGEDNPSAQKWQDAANIQVVGEITCPFCFYALPRVKEVVEETKWRRHVMNDLDAYVCLFEECETPEEMYSHSSQWLKHMREHALSWRCDSKAHGEFMVTSREDYIEHLRTVHQPRLTDTQLRLLADKSSRAAGKLFEICPLCGFEDSSCSMEEHIVGDLRLLALKSLPVYDDGNPGDRDSVSTVGSVSCSRSTVQNFMKADPQPDDMSWGTFSRDGDSEDGDAGQVPEISQDPVIRAWIDQDPAVRTLLRSLDPEQLDKFRRLPPDKLDGLFSKWKREGKLGPRQPQQGTHLNTAADIVSPMGNTAHQSTEGEMDYHMEQTKLPNTTNRFGGDPLQHPQSQMIMDNMDLPAQIIRIIPGVPPDTKKWGQFKTWISRTNAPIPDEQKHALWSFQLNQFKHMVIQSQSQGGTTNPSATANLPPNTPIPEVTSQEVQQFRESQQNFKDAPEEQIKMLIQRHKIQRTLQAAAMSATQPAAPPTTLSHEQGFQPSPQAETSVQPSSSPAVSTNSLKRRGEDLEGPNERNTDSHTSAP